MEFDLSVIDSGSKIRLFVDECFEKENQETVDLLYVVDGEISCFAYSQEAHYGGDDFLILNKFEDYRIEKKTVTAVYLILEISDSLLRQAIDVDNIRFNCNSLEATDESSYQQLREVMHKIVELILLNEYRANFLIYSNIYELLNIIIGHYSIQSQFTNQTDARNREIVKYVYLHYAETLSLTDMAQHFYMEPSYFSKYFKKNFGVNYKDYLLGIRMFFAERDLVLTDKSMTRVAVDNGFYNINSFNRAFKKVYQTTPSAYREEYAHFESESSSTQKTIDYTELNLRYEAVKKRTGAKKSKAAVIQIDSSQEGKSLRPIWKHILNVGCAEDLLSDGLKKHISELHWELSFKYARIWSIFLERLYVDWNQACIQNYDKLDEIFDTMMDLKLIPWLVINKEVAGVERFNNMKQFTSPSYEQILQDFLYHMVDRYGIREVERWKFEVAIENLDDDTEVEKYGEIFSVTRQVLKSLSPKIEVGGAGFKGAVSKEKFAGIAPKMKIVDFDFYSLMLYPYLKKIAKDERDFQRITNQDYILDSIQRMRETLQDYPRKKLYISEWNITVSNHNLINDTLFKGTYLLKNTVDMLGLVAGAGYWGASDLNYLNPTDVNFLIGGSGLLNKFGMPKSAYLAFRFLRELEDRELIAIEKNCLICKDYHEIHILFYHYQHPNQLYFMKRENAIIPTDIDKFWGEKATSQIFVIKGLEPGQYDTRTFICDRKNGSLFDLWKQFGYANNLRPSDYDYLRQKNTPYMGLSSQNIQMDCIEVKQDLPCNSFCMINILKRQ